MTISPITLSSEKEKLAFADTASQLAGRDAINKYWVNMVAGALAVQDEIRVTDIDPMIAELAPRYTITEDEQLGIEQLLLEAFMNTIGQNKTGPMR